jgi:signal transduction histidine kinase
MIWAFPLVAVFFLTETLISQHLAASIDEAATRIVTDYSPSVVALATAREDLHRIQDLVSDYLEGGQRPEDRARIASAEAELDGAVAAYLRLPFISGERELWGRVANDIVVFREAIDRTLALTDRGDVGGARALTRQDVRAAVDRASADLSSDIELNGDATDADGRLIEQRRQSSFEAAFVLALASVLLTALVAWLVYRLADQHDDLQRRHAAVLEEANAELQAFASRLSHDILSPLASTQLALDAALGTERDEGMRRLLRRGASALERVSRIARALFEFAQAAAHPTPGERGDVRAVVDEVLDEYRPMADAKGTTLAASLPSDGSVACNEGLLTAALSNLVRNAITHMGGARGNRVDIFVGEAGERVRIEVRDTGPGLTPGAEATVFEPFVRGPGATHPGLGLGLATVKRIVEAHGGAVGVESHVGAGCRFWMDLPKAHPAPP